MSKGAKQYRRFHGHPVRWTRSITLPQPKELVVLGRAVAVEYRTDKEHGGGDGTMAVYRHEFETPAFVCCTPNGREVVYIVGEKVKTTEAGIEN